MDQAIKNWKFAVDVTICDRCNCCCTHCGNIFQYSDLEDKWYDAIRDFANIYPTQLVTEGREPMLRPDRIERLLKWNNADILIVTTGITNPEKLEEFLLEYPKISRMVLSCPGVPEWENEIRHTHHDWSKRDWINKYVGTPLNKFLLNHVVYPKNITDGSCYQNLDYVLNRYPGIKLIISFDIHDNFEHLEEKVEKFVRYIKSKMLAGYDIGWPLRSGDLYSFTASKDHIYIMNGFHVKISMEHFKKYLPLMGAQIKAIIDSRKDVIKCERYKTFDQCGGPIACGEMLDAPGHNRCEKLYDLYKWVNDIMAEEN